MKLLKPLIVFLLINFGALAIGSYLMDNGPQTSWYMSLNQAPWTPPGWVFGAAWTTIMICFSMYMALLYNKMPTNTVKFLFVIQFVLNVIWNFLFFNQHLVALALAVIFGLTIVVAVFMFLFRDTLKLKTLLILPYFVWICIASSLNFYVLIYN